jgi:RNA polymerase sigma factor (sigma-70 family)
VQTGNCISGLNQSEDLDGALRRVRCRILSWRKPTNWSPHDWFEEVQAITAAARCRAEMEYEPARGVPLGAFLYLRALSSAWTRYRQECAYARRFPYQEGAGFEKAERLDVDPLEPYAGSDSLRHALSILPSPDQCLIRQLFWQKTSETQLAKNLNISQQAVSKRKRKVISKLRQLLHNAHAILLLSGTVLWTDVSPIDALLACELWL